MAQPIPIKLADLDLDRKNPRLERDQTTQAATALALAKKQERYLLAFAEDVVKKGLDPLTNIGVVQTSDNPPRYKVIEGNRRVLALKALETPALVAPALSKARQTKLNQLAETWAENPIVDVECVLFDTEDEAQDWIERRHTGKNGGLGLDEWGSEEKDRYRARRTGRRDPAGQIIDFVADAGQLSTEAAASSKGILTNVARALTNPEDRARLGVDVRNGEVFALYPADEIAKSLTYLVEELKTGRAAVAQLYTASDRKAYIKSFPADALPDPGTKLAAPVLLADAPQTSSGKKKRTKSKKTKASTRSAARLTVIPGSTHLEIDQARINKIYGELKSLNATNYPNAAAVLLRVFLELSVDHVIVEQSLMTTAQFDSRPPLAKKLKTVTKYLREEGRIPAKLKTAIDKFADGQVLQPDVMLLQQFVHNEFMYPRHDTLFSVWDELEPFLQEAWAE